LVICSSPRHTTFSIHRKVRVVCTPHITSAQPRRHYRYALVVTGEDRQPVLFVAAEKSVTPPLLAPPPPFLGLFEREGLRNLGSDERWAGQERFVAEARCLARKEWGISGWSASFSKRTMDSARLIPICWRN
jgi:hypothetical protein